MVPIPSSVDMVRIPKNLLLLRASICFTNPVRIHPQLIHPQLIHPHDGLITTHTSQGDEGSASITQALTILGYDGVHHGIQAITSPREWVLFSSAADSTFPTLPSYTGAPFPRDKWDSLFGAYEAVTDMGSFFALPLVAAYPDAKVILVERDVDAWFQSMDEAIFKTTWGWRADLVIDHLGPRWGLAGGRTLRKILLGFYGARGVDEMRAAARDRYRRHYAEVRAAVVPGERLLEFKLEDGWGPLCEFLGRDVPPDVPFPVANKRREHLDRVRTRQNRFLKLAVVVGLRRALPWVVGVGAVAAGVYYLTKPTRALEQFEVVLRSVKTHSRSLKLG
ncbi:hypothetical protein C8035_v001849 [Colletotrichum spinosum]|uniref:Uncharacterized protein n=1 Tax=Colletotrichum spinosum TaxID=1347390 RepID=A0A4R8Q015_9PEZI|nr:hypothetical protein C8035_v001849 [Colletotrichum spinosum]